MGQLKKPDLKPGPLKDLNDALHRLHLDAGEPSLPRMAKAWDKGHQAGSYKTSRSKSGVAALFSSGDLPNGEALGDLVALLMTDFMDTQEGQVKANRDRFQRQRAAAARHLRAPSPSALVNGLRRTIDRYEQLIDAVRHAENLDARSVSPTHRSNGYLHAADLAEELLGTDDPVTQELNRRWKELQDNA